jgi:hypothetical protein
MASVGDQSSNHSIRGVIDAMDTPGTRIATFDIAWPESHKLLSHERERSGNALAGRIPWVS